MAGIRFTRHDRGSISRAAVVTLLAVAVLATGSAASAEQAPTFAPSPPGATAPPDASASGIWAPATKVPVLDGGDDGTTSFVPPVATGTDRTLPRLSDIQVSYVGFGPTSKAAFEYAVTIWERMVRSNVPIKIKATWTPLGSSILGSAGSNGFLRDFPGAPKAGTYYPMALADARAGRDLQPGEYDIEADFSSNANWNTSTNGAPSGNSDLVSVVLHEIGHGLGIASSFDVANGYGYYGDPNGRPLVFDRYLDDGSGHSLLSGSGTSGLAAKLQSGTVRFIGGQAVAAKGGSVRVFSPSPFLEGSSLSHLDEASFPAGNPDSLMTPYISQGEAIHDPGNVTLGMLRDIGWSTTTTRFGKPNSPVITRVSAGKGRVDLAWSKPTLPDRGLITGYTVKQYIDGSLTSSRTYDPGTGRSLSVTGLTNGTNYQFRVTAENDAGVGSPSSLSPVAKPLDLGPFSIVDTFLNRQYQDILYRAPSAAALTSRRNAINAGTDTPGETVVALMGDKTHTSSVSPTVRLYLAYFKRLPDEGGLNYWATKARAGTSLHKASDQFAHSSEFLRTYGSLSNAAFVDLAYQNVLGRPADSGGRSYWIGKLNGGFARGSMMITVSESSENVRKTANKVAVVGLHHVLLRTVPTTTLLDASVARIVGGTSLATIAGEILLGNAYAARIGQKAAVPVVFATSERQPLDHATWLDRADLNEDGKQDLIAIVGNDAIATMLTTNSGIGAPVTRTGLDFDALYSLTTGDVNGDGHVDVVLGTLRGIRYFPGSGTGALGSPVIVSYYESEDGMGTIAVGDVTGDGLDDIVSAVGQSGTLSTWRQLADGGFAEATTIAYKHLSVPRIEVADVSGDGRGDVIALADSYPESFGVTHGPTVTVFLQDPDGELAAGVTYELGAATRLSGMAVADLTGDGKTDIAVGIVPGSNAEIRVLKNDGTGSFTALAPKPTSSVIVDLAAADMDGDGHQDLIALAAGPKIFVYRQTATGTLADALVTTLEYTMVHGLPKGLVPIDLNGDGRIDLATLRESDAGSQLWTQLQR